MRSYSLEKKTFSTRDFSLEYPAHFSEIHEGGDIIGFALAPGTIGVLRMSVFMQDEESTAEQLFNDMVAGAQGRQLIRLGEHSCLFWIEEKQYGSNDHLFWPETNPMSMYFYALRARKFMFFFSYRLPEYMEDDGRFDGEHKVMMEIIASLRLHE